jgi:hypothetical protein
VYSISASINNHNISSTENITHTPFIENSTSIPEKNINTFKECYKFEWRFDLSHTKNILTSLKKFHVELTECKNKDNVCYATILWSTMTKKNEPFDHIIGGCGKVNIFYKIKQINWIKHFRDDDSNENTFWIDNYCKGNLCNSPDLKNLPLIKKVLGTSFKGNKEHDALCPGYSDNHQRIMMHAGYQEINVAEGSNLVLLASYVVKIYESIDSYYSLSYNKTTWSLSPLENTHNNSLINLININEDGSITKYDTPHDLITNNKIFFYTVKSIHICNFTTEDEGIFKHIDVFNNHTNIVYSVKITTKKAKNNNMISLLPISSSIPRLPISSSIPRLPISSSIPRLPISSSIPKIVSVNNTMIQITNITLADKIKKKDNTKLIIALVTPFCIIVAIVSSYLIIKKYTTNNNMPLDLENIRAESTHENYAYSEF